MSRKHYYTQLSNSHPEMIEVKLKLTTEELVTLRKVTDSRASDTFNQIIRNLINQRAGKSTAKVIKGQSVFLPKKPEIAQLKIIGTPKTINNISTKRNISSPLLINHKAIQTNEMALKNRFQPNGSVPKKNKLIINQI